MLYMVIESFHGGDAEPVYRCFCEWGCLVFEGLSYVTSWVNSDLGRCFQVMDCANRTLLDEWMARWADLVEFEVVPVISSADAAARMAHPASAEPATQIYVRPARADVGDRRADDGHLRRADSEGLNLVRDVGG